MTAWSTSIPRPKAELRRDQGLPRRVAVRKSNRDEQPEAGVGDERGESREHAGPDDHARSALAAPETTPKHSNRTRSQTAATTFGFGALVRASVHTSRWAPISTRSRLLVAQTKTGMPIRSAYQRFGLFAAFAIEFETSPSQAQGFRRLLGRLGRRVRREAETGHSDERERQQPDEKPIGERARDDPACHLAVAFDHLEYRVDRAVSSTFDFGALNEPQPVCSNPCSRGSDAWRSRPVVLRRHVAGAGISPWLRSLGQSRR